MSQPDRISFFIPPAEADEIGAAIGTLKSKLLPRLISLSPADRQMLSKMGDKSRAFAQKSLEHCKRNPELVPAILDVSAFEIDMKAVETLDSFYEPLLQIVEMIDDSMMLSGSEAMNAARMHYASIQIAAKNRIPGASTINDDLAARYVRSSTVKPLAGA